MIVGVKSKIFSIRPKKLGFPLDLRFYDLKTETCTGTDRCKDTKISILRFLCLSLPGLLSFVNNNITNELLIQNI